MPCPTCAARQALAPDTKAVHVPVSTQVSEDHTGSDVNKSAWRITNDLHLATAGQDGFVEGSGPASPVKDSGWRRGNNVHLQPDGSLTEGRGPPSPVRNSAWRGGQAGSGIPMGNHASDYSTSAFQQPVPRTKER